MGTCFVHPCPARFQRHPSEIPHEGLRPLDSSSGGGGSGSGGGSSSSSSSSYLTARKVVELNNTGWGFHGPLSEAVGPRHGESATFSPASVLGATSAKALAHTAKAMVPFLGLFAPPRFVTWDVKPFGYASWDVNGVRLDSWQDRATAWFSV